MNMLSTRTGTANAKPEPSSPVQARRLKGCIATTLLVATFLSGTQNAGAQISGGPIDIQLFRPAMDSKGYITLNASQVLGHLDVSFGLILNYARRPFSVGGVPAAGFLWCRDSLAQGATCASNRLLRSRYQILNLATGNLQAAIGLYKHFEVGIGLPVTFWTGDTSPNPAADDEGRSDAQGVGDLGLHAKARLLNTSKNPLGLALVTSLFLPTGDDRAFLGSGRVTLHPSIVLDQEFLNRRLRLALNVGARLRFGESDGWTDTRTCLLQSDAGQSAECGSGRQVATEHQLTYGVGIALGIVEDRLDLIAEVIGQSGFDDFFAEDALNSAHEAIAGLRLYLATNSYFTAGLGRGLRGGGETIQYGSPDIRAFLGFVFEPAVGDADGDGLKDDVDQCPTEPEDFDGFEDDDGCPDLDNDRDGILDRDDKCPNEAEDKDGVEDDDGCPDLDVLDRDGDGIPDNSDKCPDDPEDKDGFEDDDGCPDLDNDKDGILDVDDLCPNEAEDKDGFEDDDGCPDPDNDGDGILDHDDKCPNEPETVNGFEDDDGCPDKGRVIVRRGSIQILDKIYFETGRATIKPVSYPILDAIAATVKGNPNLKTIEVQGHADERGSDAYNLDLTERRADAVRRYLLDKGVASERLVSKGYGESRPIVRGHNERAWAKNRRVEFIILERGDGAAKP